MSGNSAFQLVDERGWRRGLGNLLRAGFASWWKTNTWWVHALIWTAVLNLMVAALLWATTGVDANEGVLMYSIIGSIFPTVAVIIIMQGEVVGEKQSGTAAWILSKPVSRAAFILSKFVPNMVGVLATMVLVPGAVAFAQMSLAGTGVTPLGFLAGLGAIGLDLAFYLALTLMLGAMFSKRGGVIAIPLAFAFGQQYILGLFPALGTILPWGITVPVGNTQAIAMSLMLGQPPYSFVPLIVAACCVILFVAVGLWRFERQEF